ncbi:SIS domain-containing protein [Mumia sp. ZJ430]|uniref:SIS domain-containing protein n=1 Tax=Mumia sp. ZJ430 TaxID=2708083 RepID=UPI001FBAF8E9|nr:SIS domain-containing protein [Mumia sp. ZJ430]
MFDDGRLDDDQALARADAGMRELAGSGARVRVDAHAAGEAIAALSGAGRDERPRAVVAAGPGARLLRAVLEPVCPVPFVAWPGPGLPGWTGSLDLVVVTGAPDGAAAQLAVTDAVRRGCPLILVASAGSPLAELGASRWTTLLPTSTGDVLATTVVALEALEALGLAPPVDADEVARTLDDVAVACSPFRDLGSNRAKQVATALADATPLLWGGTVLAARSARRWAEGLRRAAGRPALAAESSDLAALLESSTPRDVFADPYEDPPADVQPYLVVLDDGVDAARVRVENGELVAAAERSGVRHDRVAALEGGPLARYAGLTLTGQYVAAYVGIGLGR